jgi:hypothetical protein
MIIAIIGFAYASQLIIILFNSNNTWLHEHCQLQFLVFFTIQQAIQNSLVEG